MSNKLNLLSLLAAAAVLSGCRTVPPTPVMSQNDFSHFAGIEDFSGFTQSNAPDGSTVLLSPEIKAGLNWNQLVVSWNADAPTGTWVKVEARALQPGHSTQFYGMGEWSPDNQAFPRTSVRNQHDDDGHVATDTLILKNPADAVQVRLTLGGTNTQPLQMKFLGLSFCNTQVTPPVHPENQAAWGKIVTTPERSQLSYPDEKGWCSPTSVSMTLARWSEVLDRPELNLDVLAVVAKVYDDAYDGTGNWPFNTAFAGSFPGMRGYITRFDDITELEDWINAGIPVILSTRWDLLRPGRKDTGNGHLVVCIGFTKEGDVVINDPATHLDRGETVRHIYKRADVIQSWGSSHNTVYLIYPTDAKVPENRHAQW